jgi:FRG domain
MIERVFNANSIPKFLDVVTHLKDRWFQEQKNWGPWFRGHSNSNWHLTPKLYRDAPPSRGIRVVEDEIRQEFLMRGPSLGRERPQNSWEWYFLMQHYGAPTRLLDWTEGALIALYFAIRDNRDRKIADRTDATVWALDPWWLNEKVLGIKEVIPPGAATGMVAADAQKYKLWLPDRYEEEKELKKELPIAVYPTHFAQRISSQRSCFTIHGSHQLGFQRIFEGEHGHVARINIPVEALDGIEDCLLLAGVDELTVFPDLDGLGRYLTAMLRDESRDKSIWKS